MEATVFRAHDPFMRFPLLSILLVSACAMSSTPCGTSSDAATPPCPPLLHDEGDACVGWRELPAPPCVPVALVRVDGALGLRCDDGAYVLSDVAIWEPATGPSMDLADEPDGPDMAPSPRLVVTLANGLRAATHGDVYALPAAWRTHPDGSWQSTLSPPTAFLTHGAALSPDEALFVGRDAIVLTIRRR